MTTVDVTAEPMTENLNQQEVESPVPPTAFSPLSDVDGFPMDEQPEDLSFCPLNDW